jgi:hypothetical protein
MEVGFWMHWLHPVQQLRMRNVNSAKLHKRLRAPCFRFFLSRIVAPSSSAAGFGSILFQEFVKRPITKFELFPPICSAQFRNWIAILAENMF